MKVLTFFLLLTTFSWGQDKPWKVTLEYIEACSCSLFCPCYFNQHAQDHHSGEHHCNFNNVPRVLSGNYGGVDLKGLKVWLNGDLGDDWATKGEADDALRRSRARQAHPDRQSQVFRRHMERSVCALLFGSLLPGFWEILRFKGR
jgi:hypothetical protein